MPSAKKRPAAQPMEPPASMNGAPPEVFTLAEAAVYLRVDEADVIALVHTQNLPGRLVGREWRFLKSAIQHWLTTALPTLQTRKEAQMALAGKYRGDPDLKEICAEAYRQRRRCLSLALTH